MRKIKDISFHEFLNNIYRIPSPVLKAGLIITIDFDNLNDEELEYLYRLKTYIAEVEIDF